jgi:dienelactone hydrolase
LAQPDAPEHRHTSPLAAFVGFVPWIAYWALIGSVSFRLAVVIAFALSVLIAGSPLVRRQRPKVFELGGLAVFSILLVVTFATDDNFLERWIQPLTNAGIFTVAATSLIIGRPFTLEYARESVPAEVAAMPGFAYINKVITAVWAGAFAAMMISALVPPIVEGDATIREGGSTLSIIGYWVVPFSALGLAALFSAKFPDWFVARLGASAAPVPAPAAPLESTERPEVGGVALTVEPRHGLLDSGLAIEVAGVPPGSRVAVQARAIDALGRGWRSRATFAADSLGTVDLATAEPDSGTWSSPDASAVIWSMRPEDPATDLFVPARDAQSIALDVEVDGGRGPSAALVRRVVAEGVSVSELRTEVVVGRLFLPPGAGPHPGVIVVGGSEGGMDSMSQTAGLLASHGFAALVVALFGADELPEHLVEIPLERIADGARALAARPEVDGARIGGLAISKGSEGLLAAAARVPDHGVRALVAISPSDRAWQAVGEEGPQPGTSSWTLAGEPLAFAPMRGEAVMPELLRNAILAGLDRRRHRPTLLHLAGAYSVDGKPPSDAAIPVERIEAPILCLAGESDEVWPSVRMSEQIASRRPASAGDEARAYPDAGHLIRMPLIPTTGLWTEGIAFGGTPEGLAAAQADAGPRILAFLGQHLSG